ncbi:MAG: thiol peroxidase, partial [Segatella oris]
GLLMTDGPLQGLLARAVVVITEFLPSIVIRQSMEV